MPWFIPIIAAVAASAASTGLAYALRPEQNNPDLARSTREGVLADIGMLPARRRIEAAARLGIPAEFLLPSSRSGVDLAAAVQQGLVTTQQAETLRALGITQVPGGTTRHRQDFTGIGDADIQGRLARQEAESQLELQRRFGPEFIDIAREQGELADPEGTAARKLLAAEINRIAKTERERPVSSALDAQMLEELQAGKGLTGDVEAEVRAVAARRAGMGDTPGVDLSSELELGPEAENRLRERLQHSLAYRSSGQTPEDAHFRDEQQTMANMASFLAGRTPQSQFGAVGRAQGATPIPQGTPLPGQNPNAGGQFATGALQGFNAQVNQQANQVSPWFAGLNALMRGAQIGASEGMFNGGGARQS